MFRKILMLTALTMIYGLTHAAQKPKVQQVEIVGPSMIPVDVMNTVGVEIVGPSMLPVDVLNEVDVKIVGPSMIPVDVMNTVEIVGPMFLPKEIVETVITADGKPDVIAETQVIRTILVLPNPDGADAMACRIRVSLNGSAVSHASWNGNDYSSFSISLPGPIDVEADASIMAELTSLGDGGECSADVVVVGTLIDPA
jgi:hypothetical protein